MRNTRGELVAICLIIMMAAAIFSVNETVAQYNYVKEGLQILDQRKRPEWGRGWCVPTSAAISFGWFAEHGYPKFLPDFNGNGKMDEDDKYELANKLGKDYMKTRPNGGTKITDKVKGIKDYIGSKSCSNTFTVTHYTGNSTKPVPFADLKRELEKCEDVLVGTPGHVMVAWAVNNTQNPDGTYNVGFIDPWRKEKYNTTMTSDGRFNWPPGKRTYIYDLVVISPKPPEIIDPIDRIDGPTYACVVEGQTYVICGSGWEDNEVYVENGVVHGVPSGTVYNTTGTVYAFANGTTIIANGAYFPVAGSVYLINGAYRQWEEVEIGAQEKFGPRLDRLLIQMYALADAEFEALELGNIDIVDTPLTEYWVERWSSAPFNESIVLSWYGTGWKAYRKQYTGGTGGVPVSPDDGENKYRGLPWKGIVNQTEFGVDSWGTFLNAYPEGFEVGDGQFMTIRYGVTDFTLERLNPIYSASYLEWRVLEKIYETTMKYDPYTLEIESWLAKHFEVGQYLYKGKLCSKVVLTLRPDATWSDGTPVTVNDFYFTFVELDNILANRGWPSPWWTEKVDDVLSFKIFGPYNFEVLFDGSYPVLDAIGSVPILPEHIWRPIVEIGDPTGFAPDPNLIGSGPWRFVEHVPSVSVLLVANAPGYYQYCPVHVNVHADGYKTKIDPVWPNTQAQVNLTITLCNLWLNQYEGGFLVVDKYLYIDYEPLLYNPDILLYVLPGGVIVPEEELIAVNLAKCFHVVKVAVHVKGPPMIDDAQPNPWICQWINVTLPILITIKEDVNEDCKVEGKDNALVAKAYDTCPGDPRWIANADINNDYQVEGKDVAWIAKYYGKWL